MRIRYMVFVIMILSIFSTSLSGCRQKSDNVNIGVTNAEVDEQLENRINYFISLYGSKENLEKAAGEKMAQIKEEQRKIITATIIAERYQH